MKSLKSLWVTASIAAFSLSVTAVASAATIALGPNLDPSEQTLAPLTQGGSCATPYTNAAIDGTPFFEMPSIAATLSQSGTSIVQIDLQSNGALAHYALEQSSGSSVLDDSALRTARTTKYRAEIQHCTAVAGSYLLYVDF